MHWKLGIGGQTRNRRLRRSQKALYLDQVANQSAHGSGSIILGCAEVGMLLSQRDVALPVFDTTEIHAAALDFTFTNP